jgi:hypothetical protein
MFVERAYMRLNLCLNIPYMIAPSDSRCFAGALLNARKKSGKNSSF